MVQKATEPTNIREQVIGYTIQIFHDIHVGEGNCHKLREQLEKELFSPPQTSHEIDLLKEGTNEWEALQRFIRRELHDKEIQPGEVKTYSHIIGIGELPPKRFAAGFLFVIPGDRYHGRKTIKYFLGTNSQEALLYSDQGELSYPTREEVRKILSLAQAKPIYH